MNAPSGATNSALPSFVMRGLGEPRLAPVLGEATGASEVSLKRPQRPLLPKSILAINITLSGGIYFSRASDLEERRERVLSAINSTTPVNKAIALVPDAGSISGATTVSGHPAARPPLRRHPVGEAPAKASPAANRITIAPASNLFFAPTF
jgi:hypothetical protein